ncbi:vacuolar protein sorting-associated protein VTA1 homolog [Trachemys scripta elegans]|uniref:vacuolar protein sorting-associated protein VTA1 homolog n=1 Tax=Trachemys scripta elegans TaxID=31138 RepID=UPI0015563483|nr:vacuolar protein sorting-associated protein VTA1 homolog [Trachemys scripta elegans]
MAATALPPLPEQFKSLQHHLRTGQELDKREPVVAYYCRLYAMQTGMKLDSKTPECRKFLSKLMDQLETKHDKVLLYCKSPDRCFVDKVLNFLIFLLFNYLVFAGEVRLTPEDFARAQKYCKYAGSALQYEDVSTAVQNLQKALKLLTTGRE